MKAFLEDELNFFVVTDKGNIMNQFIVKCIFVLSFTTHCVSSLFASEGIKPVGGRVILENGEYAHYGVVPPQQMDESYEKKMIEALEKDDDALADSVIKIFGSQVVHKKIVNKEGTATTFFGQALLFGKNKCVAVFLQRGAYPNYALLRLSQPSIECPQKLAIVPLSVPVVAALEGQNKKGYELLSKSGIFQQKHPCMEKDETYGTYVKYTVCFLPKCDESKDK